jgi:hypothetical protein
MMDRDYFLENIIHFIHTLRRTGMPISTEQAMELSQALSYIDISSRDQVYFAARSLLTTRYEHLALFEAMFNAFWQQQTVLPSSRTQKAPHAPRHDRRHHRPLLISYMAQKADQDDPAIDVLDKSATFSNVELLQRKDFSDMTPNELEAVKKLIQNMRWNVSLRRTRRHVPDPKGNQLHMRRVIASSVRHGGTPLELTWQARKITQRPIVLLADISGSMEKYSRLVLQFFYGLSHSLKNVECFVFGTRLTRITPQLKVKNIDRAISDVTLNVFDWSGGTRIGDSLRHFNQDWSRRILRRGAIVLIVSDGWERGDTRVLDQQMRFIQLRCHRLIWINPLLGKTTYQPLVEGMSTALKHVDDFLPIHNLQSLEALGEHLASLTA